MSGLDSWHCNVMKFWKAAEGTVSLYGHLQVPRRSAEGYLQQGRPGQHAAGIAPPGSFMHGHLPWQGQGFQRRPSLQLAPQPFWQDGNSQAQRHSYYEHQQHMPAVPGRKAQPGFATYLLELAIAPALLADH